MIAIMSAKIFPSGKQKENWRNIKEKSFALKKEAKKVLREKMFSYDM